MSAGGKISFINDSASPVKGVGGTTVNNCHHFKLEARPVVKFKQSQLNSMIPIKEFTCGPYTYKGYGAIDQLIFDKNGRSFWTIHGEPGVVITSRANLLSITHWTRNESGAFVGRQWFNGYGGFNYWWLDDGVWKTTIDGDEYSLPFTSPPTPKTSGSSQWTSPKYPRKALASVSMPDLEALDPEVLYLLKSPYLYSFANRHIPAVARKAWLTFELYNSNILVELLDTFTDVKSIYDLLPTSVIDKLKKSEKFTSNWRYNRTWQRWESLTKVRGKEYAWYPVPEKVVKQNSITISDMLQLIAAGRLEYLYGLKLPYLTLKNLWTSTTNEPWAQALRSYFDKSALATDRFIKPVLRHRENYGKIQVSVSIQQRLDPDYLFVELWKALYQTGVLMTFEGIWDLKPCSFAINWATKGIQALMQSLDATTISQMVQTEQWSWSIKYRDDVKFVTPDGSSDGTILYYIREYITQGTPPIGLEVQDLMPSFQLRNIPELGALLTLKFT
jgi:hypothetical protein